MAMIEGLAQFIQHPASMDRKVRELCIRSILDTMGAMVLGSRTPVVSRALKLMPLSGRATVAGVGQGFGARDAAFLNGVSGHELELDDTSSSNLGHPTVAVLPTLLALGEEQDCSGADLLQAFAVATEVECKLGRVCARALHERGWHASSVTGVVGAAAGAAYLLGLNREQIENCLGLAASMASGVRENFGTDAKSVHIGKAAADGVLAALLAREGYTASRSALDGKEGYLYEYTGQRFAPLPGEWYRGLGQPYDIASPGFAIKQYPSCSSTHRAVDAFVDLDRAHHLQAEDIAEIRVELSAAALRELVTPDPKTGDEAKFSVGFQIALYLTGRDNMPANYAPAIIFRPEIQHIIGVTRLYHAERYDGLPVDMGVGPAFVSVTLRDGREYHTERIYPVGHLTDPISDRALEEKFLRCTAPVLGKARGQDLYRMLRDLECTSVAALMRQTLPI